MLTIKDFLKKHEPSRRLDMKNDGIRTEEGVAKLEIVKGGVRVVSKRRGGVQPEKGEVVIDGDRKNPILGNRHILKDWTNLKEREQVIRKHLIEDYEPDVIAGGPIFQEMKKLSERVKKGERLAIACWCAPLKCHCDNYADGIMKLALGINLKDEIIEAVRARSESAQTVEDDLIQPALF